MFKNEDFNSVVDTFIFSLLIFSNILPTSNSKASSIPGHLKKLGSHSQPLGVTVNGRLSHAFPFYQHFVAPGKPLLLKGCLQSVDHPGLSKWTDQYLMKRFGSEKVKVEQTKKEDRNLDASLLNLKEFLSIYKKQDVYMVHSLSKDMEDLVLVPETLHCGGFQNVIQEAVMWMGSGKMTSVLHRDSMDNLLCLLDGRKDIVLIDKAYKKVVESIGFEEAGGYSHVDPLAVDMEKFPNLRNFAWHEVLLEKGDCVFIPQYWYHQVNSHGRRHMSVNYWFAHLLWFDKLNCSTSKSYYKALEPISTFGFASPNEIHRSNWLRRFKKGDLITAYKFHELLPNKPTKQRSDELFQIINEFEDPVLSWGELYSFDIDKMLVKFPDLFGLSDQQYFDTEYDEDGDEEEGKFQEEQIETDNDMMASNDAGLEDSLAPLPDALSTDEVLLPDDPVGQILPIVSDTDDRHHIPTINDEGKTLRTKKDEL